MKRYILTVTVEVEDEHDPDDSINALLDRFAVVETASLGITWDAAEWVER